MAISNVVPKFLSERAVRSPTNGDRGSPHVAPSAAPAVDPIYEQASAGWEAINKLNEDRKALQEALEFSRERINQLEAQLDHAERGLHHYRNRYEWFQRFSAEIVANFGMIRMIVDDTQRKASSVANEREQPTPPPPMAEETPAVVARDLDEKTAEPEPEVKVTVVRPPLYDDEQQRLQDLANRLGRP